MHGFPTVIYVRQDGDGESKKSGITASKFQSELMKTGEKIKAGVYRLQSVVDIAGKPEPKKSDTENGAKAKKKKED